MKQRSGAFSLVEVVIAMGLFALSILAIVGLLGPILDSIRESEETEIVSNLNELIRAELERIPFEDPGTGAAGPFIADIPGAPTHVNETVAVLYASRDLSLIAPAQNEGEWRDYLNNFPERGIAETFFRIELRNSAAFPFAATGEEATRTFHIRVYWPIYRRTGPGPDDAVPFLDTYDIGDSNPTGLSELRQMNFFTTIRRR